MVALPPQPLVDASAQRPRRATGPNGVGPDVGVWPPQSPQRDCHGPSCCSSKLPGGCSGSSAEKVPGSWLSEGPGAEAKRVLV